VTFHWFRRHVSGSLSAYVQNQLSPEQAKRVAKHLSTCPSCQSELQEITFGIQLAQKLPLAVAPDTLWNSIQEALAAPTSAIAHPSLEERFSWGLVSLVATTLLVVVALGWYSGFRQRLHLTLGVTEPSEFEVAALEQHRKRMQGAVSWDLETADIPSIRNWVQANTGLSASIPDKRPSEDLQLLRVIGARSLRVSSAATVEIGYEMDSQPVTLLTARLVDLRDAPREARFSKDVVYRVDSMHGFKMLTWGSDGQAYVMISNLSGYGQQGCLLCHTTPERRKLINNMNPSQATKP
jgi:anti-sigma factor RsiW